MSVDSRSSTPDSQRSLRDATATIDDLTRALADFSRVRSPEPIEIATCCCGKEDCETSKAWAAFKTKLESRLVLSAEVGQALLERHEAYVRRHEHPDHSERDLDERIEQLVRQNATLEKRLHQALMQSELVETSHQSSLVELKNAREGLTRLTAQHARSIGLEQRLATVMQEKEDFQQERDSATQRARMVEARISSLKEKCFGRLREDLEMQRSHRLELSEEILTDARQRLQQLQQLEPGHTSVADDPEVTKVLESLVANNEALKRDNAELQNILTETREDLRILQEEIDERRANDEPTFYAKHHRHTSSAASSAYHDLSPTSTTFRFSASGSSLQRNGSGGVKLAPTLDRRSVSVERPRRVFEPLTPETDRRSDTKRTSFTPFSLQVGEDYDDDEPTSPSAIRPLFLLRRNRAVQTDGSGDPASDMLNLLGPSPVPRGFGESVSVSSPHEGQSDSSSIADGQSSVLGILLERISVLTARLVQADALTLTNRLKRQHLHGADVGHISRNTVSGVLQELNTLRTLFRGFLEDEKVTTACTRKDLRGLFKLFKDLLSEVGQLRVAMNDVILDPTIAGRISDMAMHPSKTAAISPLQGDTNTTSSTPAWMGPLSKLLGLPGSGISPEDSASRALSPPVRSNSRGRIRPPPRIVPKREAALAATSTTVNVEFTGAVPSNVSTPSTVPSQSQSPVPSSAIASSSRGLMDIFAGAPRPTTDSNDPWIVVPKPQRLAVNRPSALATSHSTGSATFGRNTLRHFSSIAKFDGETTVTTSTIIGKGTPSRKRLSRVVDAMIDRDVPASPPRRRDKVDEDDEARDVVHDTLLERTLRPRGLSDSSIHTTFTNHGGADPDENGEHGGGRIGEYKAFV
ncbi:hypothetical protein EUX98_g2274 [Antrodiella citrinella]|uniref:Uncharacterized protein n=1 Tax=Antrodiella citrinella TaxID=2447956 RepID=A0A4S4N7L3_9APHY|nr:hypothetical protein EUX98_g2274 [Antrodiella citrinella]